ncbi:MAG: DUF255 domain-containing protein [Planctomycetota bacterium]|nr:DUF255 domain-containing protein [Planctomycetota bacterium]
MPNRLASQASPYLLQHANNPVDWWPWGPEAFAEARRRDVPIFLSIGYSTCYWCHVMERESFEDPQIAAQINASFVPIKVDREERPDVDDLYMAATVTMTGHGGWPMSVFLEPETLRPFYCGTYFPAAERPEYGRPSFPQVLEAMSMAWRTQRAGIIEQAGQVAAAVKEHLATRQAPVQLGREQVADAVSGLLRTFDRTRGGFGAAPKFPQPSFLDLLLDVRYAAGDDATGDAIDHALHLTLDAMMCGGIFDQVGGGFHRYSVDASWTVPHFEKMLYDNAQLAFTYARAHAFYGDDLYARVARLTLDSFIREMQDPATGLFYSALDAEVDHREGLNYLWNPAQVRAAVDADDAELAVKVYGLDGPGNFKDPHAPAGEPATWVVRLRDRLDRLAGEHGLLPGMLLERVDRINGRMLTERMKRKQPHLDDKCIASWNGLMLKGLAAAAGALGEPRYLEAARKCAAGIEGQLLRDGGLVRSVCRGVVGPSGVLEDYASVLGGLLQLEKAERQMGGGGGGGRVMEVARRVLAGLKARIVGEDGGVFDTEAGSGGAASDLFVRASSTHDGAIPSGLSMYLHALLDMHDATGEAGYLKDAMRVMSVHSAAIAAGPLSTSNATRALFRMLMDSEEAPEVLGQAPAMPMPREEMGQRTAAEVDPVEIYAAAERVALTAEHPHATLSLVVKVAEGWHVAAATAADHPFRVTIINGAGVLVYADYPAPTGVISVAGAGSLPVYEGTLEFAIVLEKDEAVKRQGQPLISVSYQACSMTECLKPAMVELDIAIDV